VHQIYGTCEIYNMYESSDVVKLETEMLQARLPCGLRWPSYTTHCTEPHLRSWAMASATICMVHSTGVVSDAGGKARIAVLEDIAYLGICRLRKESL